MGLRQCMDFGVNAVVRSIVLHTFPILLSVEDPLDFVKDCTAVFFITTLDDLDFPKDLIEMGIKMKFQLLWGTSMEFQERKSNVDTCRESLLEEAPIFVPLRAA